jgi:hypothetical protein
MRAISPFAFTSYIPTNERSKFVHGADDPECPANGASDASDHMGNISHSQPFLKHTSFVSPANDNVLFTLSTTVRRIR